jgi:uncharacterized membrane protein YeaQ/YmgE (transglycosylase-associated protein family)
LYFSSSKIFFNEKLNIMDLTSILLNTVAGGAGGWLGDMLKKNGLGTIGNIVAGVIGGNGLPAILSALGVLGGGGTGDTSSMIGSIASAVLGGGLGSIVGGLFKKAA